MSRAYIHCVHRPKIPLFHYTFLVVPFWARRGVLTLAFSLYNPCHWRCCYATSSSCRPDEFRISKECLGYRSYHLEEASTQGPQCMATGLSFPSHTKYFKVRFHHGRHCNGIERVFHSTWSIIAGKAIVHEFWFPAGKPTNAVTHAREETKAETAVNAMVNNTVILGSQYSAFLCRIISTPGFFCQ